MPPFPATQRAHILAEWKKHLKESNISYSEPFMLSSAFSDAASIRKWHLHGNYLPFFLLPSLYSYLTQDCCTTQTQWKMQLWQQRDISGHCLLTHKLLPRNGLHPWKSLVLLLLLPPTLPISSAFLLML
jgi:hypothetical protein